MCAKGISRISMCVLMLGNSSVFRTGQGRRGRRDFMSARDSHHNMSPKTNQSGILKHTTSGGEIQHAEMECEHYGERE